MEAARVCALRGHRVTLYERSNRLGGILNVASQPDFKQDIRRLLNFQIKQLNKLNDLEIKMNTELTEEMIQAEKPDVIFIATGSVPLKETEIEGLGSTPFVTPEDVFEGKIQTGSKAFIIGGGSVGCETALYLAKKKWSVVVAEMLPMVASDLFEANREMLLELLKENGVEILTQRKVKRVTPGKIFVSAPNREQEFTTDLLVLSVGRQPVNNLAKSAEGMVQEVYVIGDCLSARKIKDAIWEAFKKARII